MANSIKSTLIIVLAVIFGLFVTRYFDDNSRQQAYKDHQRLIIQVGDMAQKDCEKQSTEYLIKNCQSSNSMATALLLIEAKEKYQR